MMNDKLRAMGEELLTAGFLCVGYLAYLAEALTWAKVFWGYAAFNFLCAAFFWARAHLEKEKI